MTFGSLFSGIGGMDLGLERAGMTCRWQVEIDPYCRRVLAKHWPRIPKHEDVNDVGHHNLEPVDLIAGGFPCQDLSVAGKRAGLDGNRSGLWWHFLRLALDLRPRYILVENVPGLLVRGQSDVFFGSLAEAGLDAEWECLRASDVGAPHIRERIFVIAYPNGQGPQGRIGELVRERAGERAPRPMGSHLPDPDGDTPRTEPEPERWREGASIAPVDGESGDVADVGTGLREGWPEGKRGRRPRNSDSPEFVGDPIGEWGLQPEGGVGEERRRPCDPGWWLAEPDVGGGLDGISGGLDGGGIDANATEAGPEEGMQALREAHDASTDQRPLGRPEGIRSPRLLQPIMHGKGLCQRCSTIHGRVEVEISSLAWGHLRGMWGEWSAARRPPHRRRHHERLTREHPDTVRELSRLAPPPCPTCWNDGSWEGTVPRVAASIPSRVDRLRGLGNAVVPQVAEWIGRRMMEASR